MVKADDKFLYQDEEGKPQQAEFSNFDILAKKVDLMNAQTNQIAQILRDNNLSQKLDAIFITDEDLYTEMLGEETKEEKKE